MGLILIGWLIVMSVIATRYRSVRAWIEYKTHFDLLIAATSFNMLIGLISAYLLANIGFLNQLSFITAATLLSIIIGLALPGKSGVDIKRLIDPVGLITLVAIVFVVLVAMIPSNWISPVQSDANSYTLVAVMIGDSQGYDLDAVFDESSVPEELSEQVIQPATFFNTDENEFQLFGMPLFSTYLAVVYQWFGVDALASAGVPFIIMTVALFGVVIRQLSKNRLAAMLGTVLMTINPLQVILIKKTFNETVTQFLIVFLLGNILLARNRNNRDWLSLLIMLMMISIRVETIFVMIIWIVFKLWEKRYIHSLMATLGTVLVTVLNYVANPVYVDNDLIERFRNVVTVRGINPLLIIGVLIVVITLMIFVTNAFGNLAHRLANVGWGLVVPLLIAAIFALNYVRQFAFYDSATFSYDNRLIGLYPFEYSSIENIILPRLALYVTYAMLLAGLVGFAIYSYQKSKFDFLTVFIVFYLGLFLTTSQHDPNIIPWSRRYVYMVIPTLILFGGWLFAYLQSIKFLSANYIKLAGTLLLAILVMRSSFFVFAQEFQGGQELLQAAVEQTAPSQTLLVDYGSNASSIKSIRVCEALIVINNLDCLYVRDIEQIRPVSLEADQYLVASLDPNLGGNRFDLLAQYPITMEAFDNAFYEIPTEMRYIDYELYFYRLNY